MENKRIIKIADRIIGEDYPVYIIAEIGLNHQGDTKLAKNLIDIAKQSGADCVKFQKRCLEKVYKKDALLNPERQEHGIEYVLSHIKKTELSDEQMKDLYQYANSVGIEFMCSPWDETSLKFLSNLSVNAYKVASADMFNLRLIEAINKLKKPMIISTGMSFVSEIEELVRFLKKIDAQFALLHCNSTYPAPYHDINLNFLKVMRQKFGCVVGYSGHDRGISVSLAAVAMGASIVEKHITIDRNLPGPDHKASLEPDEFKSLVAEIKNVEKAMGEPTRYPSRGEYLNRETLSKSIVAANNLKIGQILKQSDMEIKSPGKGVSPLKINYFAGKKLTKRNIEKDDYILESDIKTSRKRKTDNLGIKHKWGVVARMSDIDEMIACGSDFVELHLTDVDINQDKTYRKSYDIDMALHGPEYNRDILMDLSSMDGVIRKQSVDFFNKALEHAKKLKPLFRNKNENAKFVVHPGGMSMNAPLFDKIETLNGNLRDSLSKLNSDGFEILLETMPGMPWYFGGQWYHASFMDADEIVDFSKKTGFGITLDLSHSALYCNLYKKDLEQFVKTILPVVRYLHISDAAGFNGEGLQIQDGTTDFKKILKHLSETDLWFLPEIWQGHKFGGEGFITAVRRLKKIDPDF
ncbi:MAG: hypothetical protein A3B96_01145 [Candidatus Spechtbacteria bacterium RIFCSPHIGHO2_02_FULL_43_15b]|uniref:AFP-like domain-containing protein n=1 Tax=Candidatus Spechtbacteria bacterium RIFCSPHIGHO2_01_FULL_43_30 TaxID=1802158 RepID=A0A1G2H588_9BACT|nr:MAG: hypothetical protein A2827_03545 [Candidatus Spechtbacteria bacterium RIFCSPHIGHO2_01_FULL_43_30]OGZ59071.1 MAG: hypothetical protein A3B96_01145 [Candidatus Spechtbacteria bacterium RIFCSPHIGHO2_02_FULL_43_15b]